MLAGARHIRRSQLQLCLSHLLTLFLTFLSLRCQSSKAIKIAPTKIMFRSQSTAFRVRVVSYNVLSSHLASPSHFTTLDPTHLEALNRLPLIFEKLEEEINDGKNAIVCLQEVSHDWAGAFHTWFANRGYHFITGLYGKRFNGYMGVGVAYPTQVYETLDVDISRLSDKRIGGWPVEPEASTTTKVLSSISSLWKVPLQAVGLSSPPQPDHWIISENRFNILVTATLRDKTTGKAFCIGNYHMPCCFYAPMVMSIHTEMAARHVQDIASEKGLPYILAGDWNITPDSPTYKLMTAGELDEDDETYPTSKHDMDWKCTIQPMRSAYAVANSAEPDFTNYARIGEREPFIDTLDYIFLSEEWKVESVKEICNRNEADGPFPNAKEPSDHILIAAELLLE